MEDVCPLSSNRSEGFWLKLGESIRQHAHRLPFVRIQGKL